MDKRLSPVHSSKLKKIIFSEMTNICRNQVLHTGVHLISADVIILLIGAVNSNIVFTFLSQFFCAYFIKNIIYITWKQKADNRRTLKDTPAESCPGCLHNLFIISLPAVSSWSSPPHSGYSHIPYTGRDVRKEVF